MNHNLQGNELEGAGQNHGLSQSRKELDGCFMSAVLRLYNRDWKLTKYLDQVFFV